MKYKRTRITKSKYRDRFDPVIWDEKGKWLVRERLRVSSYLSHETLAKWMNAHANVQFHQNIQEMTRSTIPCLLRGC